MPPCVYNCTQISSVWAIFTWFYVSVWVCVCACVNVDEGVCAWKQDKMRNSAFAIVFASRDNTKISLIIKIGSLLLMLQICSQVFWLENVMDI